MKTSPAASTASEIGVLAEEAVIRMDRLRARAQCDFDDRVATQVGFLRTRAADRPGLVRLQRVLRLRIGLRIDRNGAHAQSTRGADAAARDLAAVGDEDLREHPGQGWVGRRGRCHSPSQ